MNYFCQLQFRSEINLPIIKIKFSSEKNEQADENYLYGILSLIRNVTTRVSFPGPIVNNHNEVQELRGALIPSPSVVKTVHKQKLPC